MFTHVWWKLAQIIPNLDGPYVFGSCALSAKFYSWKFFHIFRKGLPFSNVSTLCVSSGYCSLLLFHKLCKHKLAAFQSFLKFSPSLSWSVSRAPENFQTSWGLLPHNLQQYKHHFHYSLTEAEVHIPFWSFSFSGQVLFWQKQVILDLHLFPSTLSTGAPQQWQGKNPNFLDKYLLPQSRGNRWCLEDHPTSSLSCRSVDEGACFFSKCAGRMGLRMPRSPYEPQLAYHPHRPGLHQQNRCPLWDFQKHWWYHPWNHSTVSKYFLTFCIERYWLVFFMYIVKITTTYIPLPQEVSFSTTC